MTREQTLESIRWAIYTAIVCNVVGNSIAFLIFYLANLHGADYESGKKFALSVNAVASALAGVGIFKVSEIYTPPQPAPARTSRLANKPGH
jgi:hypothetical protein